MAVTKAVSWADCSAELSAASWADCSVAPMVERSVASWVVTMAPTTVGSTAEHWVDCSADYSAVS